MVINKVLGFDPSVEELGRLEFMDVGVRHYFHDELVCSTLCRLEEGVIMTCRLVNGLFLDPDRIFGGVADGAVINSRLLFIGEDSVVIFRVRIFVLDEADEVANTMFVVVRDLVKNLRDHLTHLDNVRVGRLARDGFES